MSCSKGNTNRTRAQKHQNKTAFKNDLHDTSKKIKFLNTMEVTGVCLRCKEIIEWKIKFKKYKPLVAPRKCVGCEQKTVKYAYHVLCTNCSKEKKVCSKCCKDIATVNSDVKQNVNQEKITSMLKTLPERKRRTVLRYLKKQEDIINDEVLLQIEDMLLKMDNISVDDDLDSLSSSNSLTGVDDTDF